MNYLNWTIPKTWEWVKLSEIGQVVAGGTPSTKQLNYWGEDINWISPSDLTGYKNKYIAKGAKSLTFEGLKKSSAKLMPSGSVHFSTRAPIGYVVISENEISTNQGFKSIVPATEIFNEYIYFYLKSIKQAAEYVATGTTFKELSGAAFSALNFPLAPLNEQDRIVEKIEELFSELDKGIESLKTAREQLKVYRQVLLKHAFEGKLTEQWRKDNADKLETADQLLFRIQQERGEYLNKRVSKGDAEAKRFLTKIKKNITNYPDIKLPIIARWVNLLEFCTLIVDCHNKTAPYTNSGIYLIRTPCIRNGTINLNSEARYISQETYDYWSRRCPPESGDIIFTREAPMGEAGIVPDGVKICMGQRMMLIRLPKFIDSKYLLYCLMEPKFQSRMSKGSVGTGVKHLRVGDVEKLCIPFFSLEEQRAIVSKLELGISIIDEQEREIEKSLSQSVLLRQSILKKAFSGQLIPQDPTDEPASILLERIKTEKEKLKKIVPKKKKTARRKNAA